MYVHFKSFLSCLINHLRRKKIHDISLHWSSSSISLQNVWGREVKTQQEVLVFGAWGHVTRAGSPNVSLAYTEIMTKLAGGGGQNVTSPGGGDTFWTSGNSDVLCNVHSGTQMNHICLKQLHKYYFYFMYLKIMSQPVSKNSVNLRG